MLWIAPSEKDDATQSFERKLWDVADQFRANSGLKAQEKTDETGRLCRPVAVRKDLDVHGLEGEIKHGGDTNAHCVSRARPR